jgi:hypothetical protein
VLERWLEERTQSLETAKPSEQVRDLSVRLLPRQDGKRRHIAPEVHGSAGQTLAVVGVAPARMDELLTAPLPTFLVETQEVQKPDRDPNREIRPTPYRLLRCLSLCRTGPVWLAALAWYVRILADRRRSGLKR